jgi:hypothetical protein
LNDLKKRINELITLDVEAEGVLTEIEERAKREDDRRRAYTTGGIR